MRLGALGVVFDLVASTSEIGSLPVLQPCHLEAVLCWFVLGILRYHCCSFYDEVAQ